LHKAENRDVIQPNRENKYSVFEKALLTVAKVEIDIQARFPGLSGDALKWQRMMGDSRKPEWLAMNGGKQVASGWQFRDGTVLPNC
jgi:hypothetical protein